MDHFSELSFRLGTSSYIIPADILPNVHYLADKVRDVELVLFEVDDGPNNLPDAGVVEELGAAAAAHDLTYTVHLPLDLRLGAEGDEQHVSLLKAHKVIERTRPLQPWAYVLHLDGREVIDLPSASEMSHWVDQAVRAVEITAGWVEDASLLAVENLEGYPLDFLDPVLGRVAASRCIDIGHLWLDGHDPLPWLAAWAPRARVMHIHGIGERDHQSLSLVDHEKLDAVLAALIEQNYRGVLTMEIFSEQDFISSVAAVRASLERLDRKEG